MPGQFLSNTVKKGDIALNEKKNPYFSQRFHDNYSENCRYFTPRLFLTISAPGFPEVYSFFLEIGLLHFS